MKLSLDRALRWIWLLIGSLLLVLLLVGGVAVLAQVFRNAGASDDAVRIARESEPRREEARAVRYAGPMDIRGTSTRMVRVGYGGDFVPTRGLNGRRYEGDAGVPDVNVIFLEGDSARLLLDRPAFIHRVFLPGQGQAPSDSLSTWITYLMALDDADGNGKLNELDPTRLYVTDRDGRGLRPVLRPPLLYASHEALDAGRMLVYALEPPAGQRVERDRMRQRAFLYDVATGTLTPYAALDSAAARAGRLLGR
ncbi:hypothetical protein [Longimicrobium sp.]|uniref:hypothetical protein n=1 Tax=Longimicrobium sp. TaxID=2029185 RepID=UPI002E3673C4|nr:hypothetical protein [Longimicrobium sp.]HEX6041686.1 hypothetical protein [Longimicrobium sp.]